MDEVSPTAGRARHGGVTVFCMPRQAGAARPRQCEDIASGTVEPAHDAVLGPNLTSRRSRTYVKMDSRLRRLAYGAKSVTDRRIATQDGGLRARARHGRIISNLPAISTRLFKRCRLSWRRIMPNVALPRQRIAERPFDAQALQCRGRSKAEGRPRVTGTVPKCRRMAVASQWVEACWKAE